MRWTSQIYCKYHIWYRFILGAKYGQLEGHSAERMYLWQRCYHGSCFVVNKAILIKTTPRCSDGRPIPYGVMHMHSVDNAYIDIWGNDWRKAETSSCFVSSLQPTADADDHHRLVTEIIINYHWLIVCILSGPTKDTDTVQLLILLLNLHNLWLSVASSTLQSWKWQVTGMS